MNKFQLCIALFVLILFVQKSSGNSYTNHAGDVVYGSVLSLTKTEVTFTNTIEQSLLSVPLSVFPLNEQRRICADGGVAAVPQKIKNVVAAAEKQVARSKGRASKGLCSKEDALAAQSKTISSLKFFLENAVKKGEISEKEMNILLQQFN